MKTLLILGALAISAAALGTEKTYQYKDLNSEMTRLGPGKREPAQSPVKKPAKTIEEKIQNPRRDRDRK